MKATGFIAFVFAPLFAVVSFFALRQTSITIQIDVFVKAPTADVFEYVKEPRNLPLANHIIKSLEVTNETVVSDRLEYTEWTQTEHVTHIGLTSMKVISFADRVEQTIETTAAPFYGMVIVKVTYSMNPSSRDGDTGTLLSQRCEIYVPRVLRQFTNRTVVELHTQMMHNYKMLLEDAAATSERT